MEKREVLGLIGDLISQAQALVNEAVALADEHHVPFDVNFGGTVRLVGLEAVV